jgi:putative hemolysin
VTTTVRPLAVPFPKASWSIPASTVSAGPYLLRFARTESDLDRILRLRYEVYHLEHQIGSDEAHATGRDEDEFDSLLHHLVIEERDTRNVVGTYRMQTADMAGESGFSAARLFDLEALPVELRQNAVEVGKLCIAKGHRNQRMLHLLWRGMAGYLSRNHKTIVFGTCALPSRDEAVALAIHRGLEKAGACHPTLQVAPLPHTACRSTSSAPDRERHLPDLFQAYLGIGAKVLGPPAVDHAFKTTNWLLWVDISDLDPLTYRAFFQ